MRSVFQQSLLYLLLCLPVAIRAQHDMSAIEIKTIPVSDQIYYLEGSGGNIGVFAGEDGILIIDSQYAPLAEKIRAAIAEISDGDIRFLINTHLHGDHIGGNAKFSETGTIIVAQENVYKRISVEQFNKLRNTTKPPVEKAARPVITFTEDMQFHFNGEEIRVHHGPAAHTDGDAVIYFTGANVIHTGDVFVRYGFPYLDVGNGGSIESWIDYLDTILSMIDDETKVIPGHGETATKADVREFRDRLFKLSSDLLIRVEKGQSLEEIIEAQITAPYESDWGGGFIKGDDFVTLMYHSLNKD